MRLAGSDVGERSRGLALVVGWPVDGQEHLPRVEVEQALHLREMLLLLQSFLLGGVDGLGRVWGEWIPKFVDL